MLELILGLVGGLILGIISQNSGVKKVHAMGVLTIPTILNF